MYLQLIVFQLVTHKDVFDGSAAREESRTANGGDDDDDVDDEVPRIPMWLALLGLGMTTAAVAIFSDSLVGSIDEFCNESGVSRTFVGLIILPIVGNAVEHVTAVTVAMKNKVGILFQSYVHVCYLAFVTFPCFLNTTLVHSIFSFDPFQFHFVVVRWTLRWASRLDRAPRYLYWSSL